MVTKEYEKKKRWQKNTKKIKSQKDKRIQNTQK